MEKGDFWEKKIAAERAKKGNTEHTEERNITKDKPMEFVEKKQRYSQKITTKSKSTPKPKSKAPTR